MPGGVLNYECNGGAHYYQSRYVYCYLGGRGGVHFDANGACKFPFIQTHIHRGSHVPNSGLSNENVFLKGAGHEQRLCSVDPQLQQRPLYCTQAWRRASSERRGVHKDNSVFKMLFVTVHTIS